MAAELIYVETSVWSHAFAEDAPESRAASERLFAEARAGLFECFASRVVLAEFARADADKQVQLTTLLREVGPTVLELDEEARDLARAYVEHGIVPPAKVDDALHVAVASVHRIPVLVSLNFRHLVHQRRKEKFGHLNVIYGHPSIAIVSPWEVLHEGE